MLTLFYIGVGWRKYKVPDMQTVEVLNHTDTSTVCSGIKPGGVVLVYDFAKIPVGKAIDLCEKLRPLPNNVIAVATRDQVDPLVTDFFLNTKKEGDYLFSNPDTSSFMQNLRELSPDTDHEAIQKLIAQQCPQLFPLYMTLRQVPFGQRLWEVLL